MNELAKTDLVGREKSVSAIIDRMQDAVAVKPEKAKVKLLLESIVDNDLTDDEIHRGYCAVRDAEKPWWPTPGEFLRHARPPISEARVKDEANTIFDLIRDNPDAYGKYSPQVGTTRDRRRIEIAHGKAAGIAFIAAGGPSAFATMTEASEAFRRRDFVTAFAGCRTDFPEVSTLPPAWRIASQDAPKAVAGATVSQEARIDAMVSGPERPWRVPAGVPVDFDARKALLTEQATALLRENR